MQYRDVHDGIFLQRPNRFIARCALYGQPIEAHVANTGRLGELLLPGARVVLAHSENPGRKTRYTLIAVYKGETLVNIDSQAPHKLVAQALREGALRLPGLEEICGVRAEAKFLDARLDVLARTKESQAYIEVKGVTLEQGGVAMFPDAPTERGIKHLHALRQAVERGYGAYALFVVQMAGTHVFRPHDARHAGFGQALRDAAADGVRVLAIDCIVRPDALSIGRFLPVDLSER